LGAELDSLADFVNFGVAPGLILYFWQLHALGNVGWIAAMIFAISGGLRLARFNATMDDPNKPAYAANYFTGVPAPAGAITVLLPMYLAFLGIAQLPAALVALYMIAIAALMVSRLPVFSGKRAGSRVRRDLVLPIVMFAVLFIALLVSYPWHVLTVGSVLYLLCLPWSWASYRNQEQRAAETRAPASGTESASDAASISAPPISPAGGGDDRPPRLN